MACPVTPSPDLVVSDLEVESSVQAQDWGGLPADLLYRIASLLDFRTDVPSLMLTCYVWHSSLKAQLTSLQIQYLGKPALNTTYTSLRCVHAPLRRRTPYGLSYFAPLRSTDTLGVLFPSLVSIDVSGQQLEPHGLVVLQPLSGRLQHLDASSCELSNLDINALGHLTQLTALELNAVTARSWESVSASAYRPEMALAAELAAVLPKLLRLRRLALGLKEQMPSGAASLSSEAARQRQQHMQHAAHWQPWQHQQHQHPAGGPGDHIAGRSLRPIMAGLPLLRLASCLSSLTSLSCLHLHLQPLHACDIAAIAALTALTELAIMWNPRAGLGPNSAPPPGPLGGPGSPPGHHPGPGLHLTVAAWEGLMYGMQHHLAVLDVDFAGWDVRERMSLAPLRRLRALRLRRCWSPDLLLSLMGPTSPAPPAGAGTGGAAGTGAGAGWRGAVVPASAGVGSGSGWGGCTGLKRLELPEAGELITPALVAQVCSRLPQLRVLDMSRAFRTRARFQLGGDLLIRDLAVLCPQLVQLVLYDVPMHGVGLPDGRDLLLLPFVSPYDDDDLDHQPHQPHPQQQQGDTRGPSAPAQLGPSAATSNHTSSCATAASSPYASYNSAAVRPFTAAGGGGGGAAAAAAGSRGGGAGPSRPFAMPYAAGGGSSYGSASSNAAGARPGSDRDLLQMPFPRLRSLVIQGGSVFMKSRFRSIANLRGLHQLRITGMTEKDFVVTCKMGCYDEFSALTALTALHINAKQHHPPPLPPAPIEGLHEGLPPLNLDPHHQLVPIQHMQQQQQHPHLAGGVGVGAAVGPLPGAAAGQGGAADGGGGGPGPSMYGSAGSSSSPRREPHLNFITRLGTLRVLTLEALTTRGLIFSYLGQLRLLRALSLGGCIDLSPEGLDRLRRASMPSLRSLRMLGCQWDSAEAGELLPCLVAAAPELRQLELGSCPGITARRLAAALRDLTRLRHVRLHGAPISPASVQEAPLASGDLRFLACVAAAGGRGVGSGAGFGMASGVSFCMARHGDAFELVDLEDGGAGAGAGEDGLMEELAEGGGWPDGAGGA